VAFGLGIMDKRSIQVKLHEPHQAGAALSLLTSDLNSS
jgi:hypothetical protein